MKTFPQILATINKKILEHKKEMEETESALTTMRNKGMNNNRNAQFEFAAKQLILKDKILFHKACITVLDDLRKDIEN